MAENDLTRHFIRLVVVALSRQVRPSVSEGSTYIATADASRDHLAEDIVVSDGHDWSLLDFNLAGTDPDAGTVGRHSDFGVIVSRFFQHRQVLQEPGRQNQPP